MQSAAPLQAPDYTATRFAFELSAPRSWPRKASTIKMAGSCVPRDGSSLESLNVRVGWRKITLRFFRAEPDVIERLGADEQQVRCGFCFQLEVPPGRWNVTIEARSAQGNTECVWRKPIIGRFVTKRGAKTAHKSPAGARVLRYWLDRPTTWENLERELPICGWVVYDGHEPVTGVRARVGARIFAATYGIQRPDLRAMFSRAPYAHSGGFATVLRLPAKRTRLVLEARDSAGTWYPFFEREVVGGTTPGNPEKTPLHDAELFDPHRRDMPSRFAFWLEPRASWSRLPKRHRIVGWIVALRGAPVQAVRARIGSRVWETRTRNRRPEVKAAYPEVAEALQSGFSLTIAPPLGRSLLTLEASSGEGWEPFFAYRVARPLFWGRSENRFGSTQRYEHWLKLYDRLDRKDRAEIQRHIQRLERTPRFSLLIPCCNSEPRFLRAALRSVEQQLYGDWEVCAVDDASDSPATWQILQRAAQRDGRIKIRRRTSRGHISTASNDALEMATGDYIVLLDHDDELASHALYLAAVEIDCRPGLRLLYGDEDKMDENGARFNPYFKPEWNVDLLLAQNYAIHPLVVKTELARETGGFRSQFDGAQDHDLVLRCVERLSPSEVRRIPWLLYHWRTTAASTAEAVGAKPYALEARQRAVEAHLERRKIHAAVEREGLNQRVRYPGRSALVSIIIPTRDRGELLQRCLRSIARKTAGQDYEIVLLDNGTTEPRALQVLAEAREHARARVVSANGEFNFSKLCNLGARLARGEVLLLLNNDVEVLTSEWLAELTSQALRPEVGIAGARLLFPDGRVQHAGVVLNPQRVGTYAYFKRSQSDPGYFSQAQLVREVSAVTGACLAIRTELYERLGGLNEQELGVAFNDIDLCLRARELQLRVVWTPHAELIHHESSSRGLEDTAEKQARFERELAYMRQRWGSILNDDPFYNPNLDWRDQLYTLAFPPRVHPPWKSH